MNSSPRFALIRFLIQAFWLVLLAALVSWGAYRFCTLLTQSDLGPKPKKSTGSPLP